MKPLTVLALAILLSYSGTHAASFRSSEAGTPASVTRAENFSGTIAMMNGSLYVLRDAQNDSTYRLDDQQLPAKFLGKKVVVTGKLNAAVNVISVQDIEPTGA
jgi:tartrate dehydratase beta subunit/fumarate hydratase class I family protein